MSAINAIHFRSLKMLISLIFRRSILLKQRLAVSCYTTESSAAPSDSARKEKQLAEIDRKRNKSGMSDHFRNKMEENLKLPELRFSYQLTTRNRRRLYAKFGRASGVEPSIMWPTKQELKNKIEHENEFEPTLEEMLKNIRKLRAEEAESIKKREESVEFNMSKLNSWMDDLRMRKNKKLAAHQAQKEKKEQLIEEVRQFFGYRLDPKDPKFQEVLEKKEKEESKLAKEARKKDKFAREMAKLASLAQQANPDDSSTATKNVEQASTPNPSKDN